MAELMGQTLGRYQIIERLGRGGMADVYKAYQPSLDRYVALKVMHPHLADQTEFITRFKREAHAVAKLRHPNIVQVYDFDVQDERYFMAMEYVEGSQTLKEVLADQKMKGENLTLPQILKIIAKVADALHYAHSQGMIHRDIKPSNILLPNLDTPLLSDFGIARLAGMTGLTATNMNIGTPAYMAPELGRGENASVQSDIYALGIVLYECLIGSPPYDADTPYGVILKHINDPLIPPHNFIENLPDDVERIVLKSLAKDPNDRFSDASQMRDFLKAASEEAEKSQIILDIKDTANLRKTDDEHRFEALTVIENDEASPIVDIESKNNQSKIEGEEKNGTQETSESSIERTPSTYLAEGTEPRKKIRGWVWGVALLAIFGISAGVYFLYDFLRTQAVLVLSPNQHGYDICHLNGKCETLEFSSNQLKNISHFGKASWSPDGKKFVFSACQASISCGLFTSDLDGNVKPLVVIGEINAIDPAWSPDGNYIAFHGSGELYTTNLDGKFNLLAKGTDTNCPFGIAWSPDSQWLAWLGGSCAVRIDYVYTIHREKRGYQEVYYDSTPQLKNGMIAWAPDGKSIIIMNNLNETYRLDVNCEFPKGCSRTSQTKIENFPETWLSNHTPQWQLNR